MTRDRQSVVRRAYQVHGRVQGVGFRWFTRTTALELGLRGTVRNAPDGSVEVVAEGAPDRVAELERRLREGPPGANVERVGEVAAPPGDLPDPFAILR